MRPIPINNFNRGGLADSEYSGVQYSLAEIVGIDLHSRPGVITANQALAKVSGNEIDGFIKAVVDASDGYTYWFSSDDGQIWQEDSDTFTLIHTTTPEIGEAGCMDAIEFEGYIYWATEKKLHRIKISETDDWGSNAQEDWASLGLDVDIGGVGFTYTLPTSLSEADADKDSFIPSVRKLQTFVLNINAKGTGDWTLTLHDEDDNSIGTIAIANASLPASGRVFFVSSSPFEVERLTVHHVHLVSTVGDGSIVTSISSDFEGGALEIQTECDTEYHPMAEVNRVLFIGNRNYIDQVEVGVFTPFALDFIEPYRAKVLGKAGVDLLIGTTIDDMIAKCKVYRWNTFGVSFSSEDDLPETGVNCILDIDNYVIVNAGTQGHLYSYDGVNMIPYKRVPGTYSPSQGAWVHPNATVIYRNQSLFGFSNVEGNPANQGLYSLGRYSSDYPLVQNIEFPISAGLTGVEMGAVLVKGDDLYVSWKEGSNYGIDKLDYSQKYASAYFATRVIAPTRDIDTDFKEIRVDYEELPASTSITIQTKNQSDSSFQNTTEIVDTQRKQVRVEELTEGTRLQVKVSLGVNSNDAPIIEDMVVYVND